MADRMERLQILIRPEQRRRLTQAARSQGTAVTALVREAIDEKFPPETTRQERRAAADRLLAMRVPHIEPDELNRLLDDRFDIP
jgi:uncharacterized protein (DUF1778 family)